MSYENESFCKDVKAFRTGVLEAEITSCDKLIAEYNKKVEAVELPQNDANGLLAAITERQSYRAMMRIWENQRRTLQRVLNDYRDHFKDYLD